MAHGHRYMQQVSPDLWVVKCRICRKSRATFTNAAECHTWWRHHAETVRHSVQASPKGRSWRVAEKAAEKQLSAENKAFWDRLER